MMMEIGFTLCLIAAPETCEERRIGFAPALPGACIWATGPEFARALPDGWVAAHWHCLAPPAHAES